jgi:hypothetical protein
VGSLYKTPLFPIWVIGSTSHFSVLFSLDKGPLTSHITLPPMHMQHPDITPYGPINPRQYAMIAAVRRTPINANGASFSRSPCPQFVCSTLTPPCMGPYKPR